MVAGNYREARGMFRKAHGLVPEDWVTLHDLGDCCVYFAKMQFEKRNRPAADRELDQAVEYYQRAINAHPGFQAALIGKNVALELRGQFEEAVLVAEWASTFVGPSAEQQLFLAREMEERGDIDAAHLRYRQALAMEPRNADAHEAIGRFYYRQDKNEQAIRHLIRTQELDPARSSVAALLAELEAR